MNRFWILLLVLFATCALADSDIYQTTDSNGNVNFSDKPSPGAKKVKLSPTQSYKTTPVKNNDVANFPPNNGQEPQKQVDYSSLKIITPAANETFRDPSAPLVVSLEGPELAMNHRIVISLDTPDNRVTPPSQAMAFNINSVPRGAHTVFASIIDENDNVIYQTPGVPFYMQLPRIDMQQGVRPNTPVRPIQPVTRPIQRVNSR